MATTAFPTVVDNLIAALRAAPALAGVRVFDGIEIDSSYPGDFIVVGDDGGEDGDVTAGSGAQQFLELGNLRQFEDASVNCMLASASGATSLTTRRTRAFALLSAIDTAIRADVSLGGACLYSTLDTWQPSYRQTDAGAAVIITFTVTYRART
jgi:hypothetical protein